MTVSNIVVPLTAAEVQALAAGTGVTLTLTPPAVVTAPNPPPPSETAKARKANLLAYLPTLVGKGCLAGQTAAIWSQPLSSTPLDEAPIAAVKAATGKDVALVGLILNYATNSWAVTPANTEAEVAQYLADGHIPHVSLYWNMPTGGAGGSAPQASTWDAADFHASVTPGTAQYTIMQGLMQQAIAGLKACVGANGVIFLRPFIEINGNWNFYGDESGPDFIALWLQFFNACQAAGLGDNLIWVWNVNDNVGNYTNYFPGTNQVDVVSIDVYATAGELVSYINSVLPSVRPYKKSIIVSEYGGSDAAPSGNNQLDNMVLLNTIKSTFPDIVGFIQFNGTWAIAANNNATQLMTDPYTVTLDKLPVF